MTYFTIRDQASGSAIKISAEQTTESTDVSVYAAYHNIQFAHADNRVFGTASSSTTADFQLLPAAGAGLRNYVVGIQVVNTGPNNDMVTLRDGSGGTALAYIPAPANYGGQPVTFFVPVKTTANTALYAAIDNTDTGGSVYVSVQGYTAA